MKSLFEKLGLYIFILFLIAQKNPLLEWLTQAKLFLSFS